MSGFLLPSHVFITVAREFVQDTQHAATTHSLRQWTIATFTLAIIVVMFVSTQPQGANDFWMQAKVGELIVRDHQIPSTLLFPFTQAQDFKFNAHEWLPSILFFSLAHAVDLDGLALVTGAAGLLLFAMMVALCYRRSNGNLALSLVLGLLPVAVENYRHTLRPELVSLLLLVAYLYFLDFCRSSKSIVAGFGALLVVVLWANTHGSFILAPVIALACAVGALADKYRPAAFGKLPVAPVPGTFFLIAVLSIACTLANPSGLEQLKFVVGFSQSNIRMYEWLPSFDPRVMEQRGFKIALLCAIGTLGAVALNWRRMSAIDVLLLFMFFTLAVMAMRFMVYVGIISAFVLARLAPGTWKSADRQMRIFEVGVLASGSALTLAIMFGNAQGNYPHVNGGSEKFSPPMVDAVRDPSLQGNVINSAELGAELVYLAFPRLRPSIDSRIDSYGADYFAAHNKMLHDKAALASFIQARNVRYMLLDADDLAAVVASLGDNLKAGWTVRVMDTKAILLARIGP